MPVSLSRLSLSHLSLLRRLAALLLPALALLSVGPESARAADQFRLLTPVTPACVSSPFGPRVLPNRPLAGTFHYGIDLPAPAGAPVRAIAPGEVIRIQRHGAGGLEILVQHPGFVAVYSHLGRVAPRIAEGRRTLFGGEVIGVVGHSGVTYGMHLYFAMLVNGRPVDPAPYLAVAPCGTANARHLTAAAQDEKRIPARIYADASRLTIK